METEYNNKKFQRNVAVKSAIKEIILSTFVLENEQNPNHLLTEEGQKIFRINVIATIISKEKQGSITNLLIDDGTDKIIARSFEDNETINCLKIGDVISIIGKVRVYNQEKYISPEIIKPVHPLWLKIRSLELKTKIEKYHFKTDGCLQDLKAKSAAEVQEDSLLPIQKLSKIIEELDQGDGVPIELILDKSPLENTDQLIEKMLRTGDLFQNKPGKIKIL